jgi:hypothetical protein
MKILEKLNKLKDLLKNIESDSREQVPEEISKEFLDNLTTCRDAINRTGNILEKYVKDKEIEKRFKKELEEKMANIKIYSGLDKKIKEIIVDRIFRNKGMNLLTDEGFQEYIEKQLMDCETDELIKKAYSKYDILKLGESIESIETSETKKYDAGMNILRDLVKTPFGRDEAIAHGIKRITNNIMTMRYYLSLYYKITKEGEKEKTTEKPEEEIKEAKEAKE